MALAKFILTLGFTWGLGERTYVAWSNRNLSNAILWLIALDTAGLVVLSWME